MLDCEYFNKSEIPSLKKLVAKLTHTDTKKIAEKLGITVQSVQEYKSMDKKLSHKRVPQLFIDAAQEIIAARTAKKKSIESSLKNV
jgi:hypothetical protein